MSVQTRQPARRAKASRKDSANPETLATTAMTAAAAAGGGGGGGETTPQRQIRAKYDDTTITVYQAYSAEIATAAVREQKLHASPSFSVDRMTWIKPSWCWMMYRCGYSHKDGRQTNVLAIKMKHEHFIELLGHAQLAHEGSSRRTGAHVIVQWDPERGPALERYAYRSIQIGISKSICERWVADWIVDIVDVTHTARALKDFLDHPTNLPSTNITTPPLNVTSDDNKDVIVGDDDDEEEGGKEKEHKTQGLSLKDLLIEKGLMPVERVFEVPDHIRKKLNMDVEDL